MDRGKNPRTGVATNNDQSPRVHDPRLARLADRFAHRQAQGSLGIFGSSTEEPSRLSRASGVRRLGQTMAENRVKLGLAGAVLLAVGGGLAALAARSGGGSGDDD
jgi:hypothetical protein